MIHDRKRFNESLVNWDFLAPCFGHTGIRLSDIDGMAERNGYFLFIEAKGDDVSVKNGQGLALKRLAQLPSVTVLVLWGHNNAAGEFVVSAMRWIKDGCERHECTTEDVIDFVNMWWDQANAGESAT